MMPVECVARGYLTGSGLHRLPEDRRGVRHRAAARSGRGQQVRRAAVHPGHQSRARRTRREHLVRRRDRPGRRRAGQPAARAHAADLHPGRRPRADARASSSPTPSSSSASTSTATCVLADEVFTPDSSRYWRADSYQRGRRAAQLRQAVRPQLADQPGIRLGPRTATSRRRRCPPTSSTPPASAISKPTNAFRA